MMKCTVTYMSGAGNLFTVVSAAAVNSTDIEQFASFLCDATAILGRRTDGLLIVSDSDSGIAVQFFNPDGSTGMMCGNGARCAVAFAIASGITTPSPLMTLSMAQTRYTALLDGERITIIFPPPRAIVDPLVLEVAGHHITCAYVDVGSEHVVINHSEFERWRTAAQQQGYDFAELAPRLRYHQDFPRGVNVNLYSVQDESVELTTYERGVEAITGACGTGALATAVVLWLRGECTGDHITIIPPSREPLSVRIGQSGSTITELALSGTVHFLAQATVELPDIA